MKYARTALTIGLVAALSSMASAVNAQANDVSVKAFDPSVNSEFLKHTDDVTAVTQVVLRERQARDRGWWDQMLSTYWPDSHVDLSWYHGDGPGFVAGSRRMAERGAKVSHRMFAPVVDMKGNKAHVEVHALTWSVQMVKGVRANFETSMRLNYRLIKRNGEWKILSMTPIYEFAKVSPDAPGDRIDIPASELSKYRRSYALLSWNQAQNGYQLGQDELGDDRPEAVTAFYEAIKKWLND